MKPLTLTITNEALRRRAYEVLAGLTFEPPWVVSVTPARKDRSTAQNSMLWMWYTVFADGVGMTKDELHEEMKRKHLIPILIRDDPEYGEMITAAKVLPESAKRQIVKLTSTTRLNVKQMTEYLTDVERSAIDLNITLPHPEDQYHLAMGRKREK